MGKTTANCTGSFLVLCGNKLDLASSHRSVSFEEARQYADSNGAIYVETSARTGENVQEMFEIIAKKLLERNKLGEAFYSSPNRSSPNAPRV